MIPNRLTFGHRPVLLAILVVPLSIVLGTLLSVSPAVILGMGGLLLILLGGLFLFARPEWSPVSVVLLWCTLPALAYGVSVDLMGFSLRPHTIILLAAIVLGFVQGRSHQPLSPRVLPVWAMLFIVLISWASNGAPGILNLINPIAAWSIFLVTIRLGRRLQPGLGIAILGVAGVLLASLAAATVLFRSDALFYALFSQNAGSTIEALTLSTHPGGRGMYIRNGEGFLLIVFCLLTVSALLGEKHRWLAAIGALIVGSRVLTAYARAFVIVYLVVGAMMIATIRQRSSHSLLNRTAAVITVLAVILVGWQLVSYVAGGQSPLSGSVAGLVDAWTLRWTQFFEHDARLSDPTGSGGGTIVANRDALRLFGENPLWLFLGTSARGRSTLVGISEFHVDVSGPLGIMVVWGLAGLIMVVWFVWASARSALWVLKRSDASNVDRIVAYGYLFALLGYIVQSAGRFPSFAVDSDVAVLCLLAGWVEATRIRLDLAASPVVRLRLIPRTSIIKTPQEDKTI